MAECLAHDDTATCELLVTSFVCPGQNSGTDIGTHSHASNMLIPECSFQKECVCQWVPALNQSFDNHTNLV
jgi:hypothetical protein